VHPYDYIRAIRRGWPIMVVATIFGLVAAGVLSALATTHYTATTRIYFNAAGGPKGEDLANAATYAQARVQGFGSLARSTSVLAPVAAELGDDASPAELSNRVSVKTSLTTTLVDVSFADTSAKRAAKAADAVSGSLINQVNLLERPDRDGPSAMTGTIVSPARVPSSPSSPNWPVNLFAGLVVGLVIGSGVVVTRDLAARARDSVPAGA
jgi:capsular polysaccharide biosynthesis protein